MYESFYHFQKTPFRLTPDPQFFFPSAAHSRGLAYLQYALHQGEGFVVISGTPGTGKTELMLNFMKHLPQSKVTAAKIVSSRLNDNDLLQLVANSFVPSSETMSKGSVLKYLEEFFYAQAKIGKSILLLIDEAHNLPVSSLIELGMLCNFQVNEKPVLQCFLMGQTALDHKLNHPQLSHLKQRVIISMHLESFNRQETQEYIEHRMRIAANRDSNNRPHFTDRAFSAIHHYAEGLPRRINAVCHRVLLEGYLEEKYDIDFKLVNKVIREMQEEAVVNTNTMDLDFAQIKTAPVHQIAPRPASPSASIANSQIAFDTGQPSNNIVHFSPATNNMPQQSVEPTSFKTTTQIENSPTKTAPQPDMTTNRSPEAVTPAEGQDNKTNLVSNQSAGQHWADLSVLDDTHEPNTAAPAKEDTSALSVGNRPVGNSPVGNSPVGNSPVGNSPVGNSPVINSPAVNRRKLTERQNKTSDHTGQTTKKTATIGKRSVYQLASDHRDSGMLDKELLTLASWYQPQNTAKPSPGARNTEQKTITSLSKDDSMANVPEIKSEIALNADNTAATSIDHQNQLPSSLGKNMAPEPVLWITNVARRLPLSPLGIALSALILGILWWFTYGPGTHETLRWLNAVANMVTA